MKTVSRVTTLLRWKKNHYLSFIRPRILYASSLDSLNNLVSHFNRERFLAKKNVSSCYEETERHFTTDVVNF